MKGVISEWFSAGWISCESEVARRSLTSENRDGFDCGLNRLRSRIDSLQVGRKFRLAKNTVKFQMLIAILIK